MSKLRRAAVVIGVNKTGNLITLKSAVACAKEMAEWLEKEGFKVELITDEDAPVTGVLISDTINQFVTEPPRFHQLVIYFSGHGYWQARKDYWLLSKAPTLTHEAINLEGAMDLARYSGIPNVAFISDACRSIPDSRSGAMVSGIDAFPNLLNINTISKIDYFKATSDAQPAYEVNIDDEPKSVLSYAFISAFKEASEDMVKTIKQGDDTLEIVPNRRLEQYLQDKVNSTLEEIDPNLIQQLDINVPSSEDTYIGTFTKKRTRYLSKPKTSEINTARENIRGTSSGSTTKGLVTDDDLIGSLIPISRNTVNISTDASDALDRTLSARGVNLLDPALDVGNKETELQVNKRLPNSQLTHLESGSGFSVSGAVIIHAMCTKGLNNARTELLDGDSAPNTPTVIRVWNAQPGVTVLLRLSDGRGVVLPALSGYIGHLIIKDSGLANVSYVPSSYDWRWQGYEHKKQKINRLRALVAIAIEQNVFKLSSDKEANALADMIRIEKAIDPTLGLYAAHAYYQAGEDDRILSIKEYMANDINAVLFDIHVLTSRNMSLTSSTILPFCPLLTQTWNLLRARNIQLDPQLKEASNYLCNSLWTTFESKGADLVTDVINAENKK